MLLSLKKSAAIFMATLMLFQGFQSSAAAAIVVSKESTSKQAVHSEALATGSLFRLHSFTKSRHIFLHAVILALAVSLLTQTQMVAAPQQASESRETFVEWTAGQSGDQITEFSIGRTGQINYAVSLVPVLSIRKTFQDGTRLEYLVEEHPENYQADYVEITRLVDVALSESRQRNLPDSMLMRFRSQLQEAGFGSIASSVRRTLEQIGDTLNRIATSIVRFLRAEALVPTGMGYSEAYILTVPDTFPLRSLRLEVGSTGSIGDRQVIGTLKTDYLVDFEKNTFFIYRGNSAPEVYSLEGSRDTFFGQLDALAPVLSRASQNALNPQSRDLFQKTMERIREYMTRVQRAAMQMPDSGNPALRRAA